MRKSEFAIVDAVRKQDMEYLLKRFKTLMLSDAMVEVVSGIYICYKIVKEYQDSIGSDSNDNNT